MTWIIYSAPTGRTAPATFTHRARPTDPVTDLNHERIKRRPVLGGFDHRVRTSGVKPLLSVGGRLLEPHRQCAGVTNRWWDVGPFEPCH